MVRKRISPYAIILFGFLALILLGFWLLMLPCSTVDGIAPEDALFLSASAVCITGLSPVVLSETLTGFGQALIALLVQVGGLGFVTVAMTAIVSIGSHLGIAGKLLVNETLGSNGRLDYRKFLMRAVTITLVFELIGFLLNLIALKDVYSGGQLVWISLFHSISAFNNAGLDLFGAESMIPLSGNVLLILNTSFLTIIGGLGFIVYNDVICLRRWKRFSVHTKIVLIMTPALLIAGTLFIYFAEWGKIGFLDAFFMSTMARTCGFSTQRLDGWGNASLCILNFLMFIGAAPASTGGGIKSTTFFVFLAMTFALVRGRETITFHRKIERETIMRAMLVTFSAFVCAFTTVTLICAIQPELPFAFVVTETVSALANVGLSAGITSSLALASKLIITVAMFIGRIGFLTILLVIRGKKRGCGEVGYVKADIIIG